MARAAVWMRAHFESAELLAHHVERFVVECFVGDRSITQQPGDGLPRGLRRTAGE